MYAKSPASIVAICTRVWALCSHNSKFLRLPAQRRMEANDSCSLWVFKSGTEQFQALVAHFSTYAGMSIFRHSQFWICEDWQIASCQGRSSWCDVLLSSSAHNGHGRERKVREAWSLHSGHAFNKKINANFQAHTSSRLKCRHWFLNPYWVKTQKMLVWLFEGAGVFLPLVVNFLLSTCNHPVVSTI